MADNYGLFWNSINADRTYDADSFAEWLRKFFTTGVFNGELQVTPDSGMVVNVAPGYANIEGKVRFFENSNAFTIDPASGVYPRIDNIVVRSDSTARAITCEYVKGDYSGDSPSAPVPTRTGGVYEIVLAQIYVSAGATAILTNDITDTRADDSLCGWVTSTVEGVPMDQIVAQMQAEFMAWYDRMKDQLSEDAAGHLQAEIDTLQAAIDSAETAIEKHNQSLAIEETGTVAAQMHKTGQYFMLDNRMMVAIADIAEGDTFEFLTNYKHANVGNELSELKSGLTPLYRYYMTNCTAVSTRGTINNGGVKKIGSAVVVNLIFKAVATASNSPQIATSPYKPRFDSALSCIDITNGIGSAIESDIPCGIARNGNIYVKTLTTNHVYALTGVFITADDEI